MMRQRDKWFSFLGVFIFLLASSLQAQDSEALSEEQMKDFLLNAKVIRAIQQGKGVTNPFRLTLSNGTLTHDGAFQSIDEFKATKTFDNGKSEMNFRDSYKYNIAAYELAKLLGLGGMMPVTVERKWDRRIGSLSWWLPAKMDEEKRRSRNIQPPDLNDWNRKLNKMAVFSELVYDTDRNGGNLLISEKWEIWMIDFSRAFRLYARLQNPQLLTMCDRSLLEKLRQLDAAELAKNTKNWLTRPEIQGVMARRDIIVKLFESLIAEKGEKAVLYDSPAGSGN
jgi:hypothetical protein